MHDFHLLYYLQSWREYVGIESLVEDNEWTYLFYAQFQ